MDAFDRDMKLLNAGAFIFICTICFALIMGAMLHRDISRVGYLNNALSDIKSGITTLHQNIASINDQIKDINNKIENIVSQTQDIELELNNTKDDIEVLKMVIP